MPRLAVIWRAAGLLMATGAESVVEVLPPVAWRRAPGLPGWVRGLFSCRGRLLPLVDAARLLGAEPAPDRMLNRVLVLRAAAGASEWNFGLWVESILDLDRIDFQSAGAHPGFASGGARVGPIAETRFGQVQYAGPPELLAPEQAGLLTQQLAEALA